MDFTELNKWHDCDMAQEFSKLTPAKQEAICEWIRKNFIRRKTPNYRHTSYGLKALFENSPNGFSISNGTFKGAMDACATKRTTPQTKIVLIALAISPPLFLANDTLTQHVYPVRVGLSF